MGNKNLTVIIPTYNSAKYIERLVDCLENQSYKDFSILIVDDYSTDNTVEILINKYSQNPRIQMIFQDKNYGVSYTRNVGIKNAKTPYITFIDSDDWIDINTFQKCLKYLNENIDIINYGLSYDYFPTDKCQPKYIYSHDCIITGSYALKIYGHTIHNEYDITPIVNNKIYRREFLIKNNIYFNETTRYQEDDIFTFKTLLFAENYAFVSSCYYHYLQNPTSAIHQVSNISIDHFILSYKHLLEFLTQKNIFEQYKSEFYLKFKGSLIGVIRRTIRYCNDSKLSRKLLVSLFQQLLDNFNIEEFLLYCNFETF